MASETLPSSLSLLIEDDSPELALNIEHVLDIIEARWRARQDVSGQDVDEQNFVS